MYSAFEELTIPMNTRQSGRPHSNCSVCERGGREGEREGGGGERERENQKLKTAK